MKTTAFIVSLEIPTADGVFVATYSERGLCGLQFPAKQAESGRPTSRAVPARVRSWHVLTTRAVKAALSGKSSARLPPLDLSCGTDFQQQVWNALRAIPAGGTRTYGEIARKVGNPGACRAVGGACGANPIPVLVPCHRVLAGGSKLGGFSGGLDWKKLLLAREGVLPG